MTLTIKQKQLTFFIDKFDIYENDNLIYIAKSIFFSFPKKIKVFDIHNVEKIALTKPVTLIYPEFDISFSSGTQLALEGQSWIYDYFILRVPEGTFEVHHQKGLKLAIFLNEEQVAEIVKKRVVIMGGKEYKITSNSDIDQELLIATCLAWDLSDFDDENTFAINIGRIGPVKKKAENNWKPIR